MAVQIPLTQGHSTLVDEIDAERVKQLRWSILRGGAGGAYLYAAHTTWSGPRDNRKFSKVLLHRFIMDAPAGMVVDHINGDGLDNRRENLRVVTQRENLHNRRGPNRNSSTGVRNVYRRGTRYQVLLRLQDRMVSFGYFDTLDEAAERAVAARAEHYSLPQEIAA